MKKWCLLLAVLVLTSVSFAALLQTNEGAAVTVEGKRLVSQRVEQTVTCSGVVEAGEQRAVFAETGCVIGEVLVKEGQAVSVGDVVATVNKQATRQQQERISGALALTAMPEEICAQTEGIVLAVAVNAGEWLEAGQPCVLVAAREELQVRVAIREKHLNQVKCGQSVSVSGAGLQKSSYCGTLEEISAAVSNANGGAVVEGVVRLSSGQADASFRLGLSAKAKIVTEVAEAGVLIPYEAVLRNKENSYIYIVENGMAKQYALAETTELSAGVLVEDTTLVDAVVITQPQLVTEGTTVSVTVREVET